jgi:hypothetical protein
MARVVVLVSALAGCLADDTVRCGDVRCPSGDT